MTVEVPTDASRTRRIVLIVAACVVSALLLAGGVWTAMRPSAEAPRQTRIEPAEETSATTTTPPVPAVVPSASAEPTPAEQPQAETPGKPPAVERADKVVFRLGERLYVANADGSDATPVAPAAERYSLSPNGRMLAVVFADGEDGRAGKLSLFDATTGAVRYAGKGVVRGVPVWTPDSSAVIYTVAAGDNVTALRRVNADGSGDRSLVKPGALPKVSPDGVLVAYQESEQPMAGDLVLVKGAGAPTKVAKSAGATAWAWGAGGELYFAKPGSAEGAWDVWVWRSGDGSSVLGTLKLEPPAFAVADLLPSPDGTRLLVSASGDDDYSRLWMVDTSSGASTAVSTRRDAYPCCWSSDGSVLYFEGNAYQGEASALARIAADGTGRRLIVTGAER